MHGEYLRWCGPDKTHIVLLGHGWCESPLPRVVTETSAQQRNVEKINHCWPAITARARQDTQDVKVTNDDEERESWGDHDEARKGLIDVSLILVWKLEAIRIGDQPLLDFLVMSLAVHTLFRTGCLQHAL